MLFKCLLLIHCKHINAERSVAAIFHILKGKKSIQTVQDLHIFNLENYYGTGRFISKKQFDDIIESMRKDGILTKQAGNNHYAVTKKGLDWLDKNQSNVPIKYFNGFRYEQISIDFYERLILLIQTLTNSKMNNYSFIPVIGTYAAENWVKTFYRKTNNRQQTVLTALYKELSQLLSYFKETETEIFVDRLSGYNVYGLSINQLATKYGHTNEDIQLMITGMVHHMLSIVEKNSKKFPLIFYMIEDLMNTPNLSNSAKLTWDLLDKNYSICQIANKRQLKENTIYDHIIEIAYNNDQFPIINYISKNKQDIIIKAINQSESYKLKQIKSELGNEFSYFEIRLVFAAYRNLLKSGDKDVREN